MARRRGAAAAVAAVVVPPDLLDHRAATWGSAPATVAWCREQGVPPPGEAYLADARSRHRAAARVWAMGNGHASPKAPGKFPDWDALRDLGIVFASPDTRAVLRAV